MNGMDSLQIPQGYFGCACEYLSLGEHFGEVPSMTWETFNKNVKELEQMSFRYADLSGKYFKYYNGSEM